MKNVVLYLSCVVKAAGFMASMNGIPFIKPEHGVLLALAASLAKDTANRLADLLDNGEEDGSLKI
jgi:hypothetical protein